MAVEPGTRMAYTRSYRGKLPYGNVRYADPGFQEDGKPRYPIDNATHVRAAWSYINQADNARRYSGGQLSTVRGRIRSAMRRFGIDVYVDAATGGR